MIQVNELRIGNWVMDKEGGEFQVASVSGCMIGIGVTLNLAERFIFDIPPTNSVSDIHPIQLTPERLEKCGLEIHSKHSFWTFKSKNGWWISMWMEDNPVAGFEKKYHCYYGDGYIEIKYLHDLQNLYYITNFKQELIYDTSK